MAMLFASPRGKEALTVSSLLTKGSTAVKGDNMASICLYRDHAHLTDNNEELNALLNKADAEGVKGTDQTFPVKLHQLLSGSDDDGFSHIVSWQPHGRSFIVKNHKDFVEKVLPCCFRQTKFASFQRQLNLYGFRRITTGRDKGGYYHELFMRGRALLALKMQRTKIKGTGARKPSQPKSEPNFYSMPFVYEIKDAKQQRASLSLPVASTSMASIPNSDPSLVSATSTLPVSRYSIDTKSAPLLSSTTTLRESVLPGASGACASLLPPAGMSSVTRREIMDELLASSARMQALADGAFLRRSAAQTYSNQLKFASSLMSSSFQGSNMERGPLHLNALNKPGDCAVPDIWQRLGLMNNH